MLAQALTGSSKKTSHTSREEREFGNKVHVHKKHLDKKHSNEEIKALATLIRKEIILMLLEAESGHSAGPLGMADVFAALYFSVLKHNPLKPNWEERDRVILSNGHICPVLYATLAECGYFSKTELRTLRKLGSRLQGHPHFQATNDYKNQKKHAIKHPSNIPGLENTSGPLGQGLSQAIGIATALKMNQKPNYVYCFMSDGELQEGQNWEAFLYAANKRLNNLTILIDRNGIQIDGYTEQILPLESIIDKFKSFNWNVYSINGHRIETIIDTLELSKKHRLGPSVIICQTTPGKDVDFMENLPEWHGKPPDKKQAKDALDDLRSLKGRIWWE
ncbi:MAG: transketolase [Patescibacteria group bacterium]|nr:MAG: transketolase [Patescibacteria group bacterium]